MGHQGRHRSKWFAAAGLLLLFLAGAISYWFVARQSQTSFENTSRPETGDAMEPVQDALAPEETATDAGEPGQEAPPENQVPAPQPEAGAKKQAEPESQSKMPAVTDRLMDSGFQAASGRAIDTIIIHSSYDALGDEPYSVSGLIKEYEEYGVSAHYLIDRKGMIYRLVRDKDVSYHAGAASVPDGRTNVNAFSIGIELMNTMEDEYTDAQYAAVQTLVDGLKSEYPIKYVLGHDDIAPGRKTDPWNFDWKRLKD